MSCRQQGLPGCAVIDSFWSCRTAAAAAFLLKPFPFSDTETSHQPQHDTFVFTLLLKTIGEN